MKVIIIGAGAAGLSIGWRLAQAGLETVILERAQPGRAATWASAGMLAATAETGETPEAETRYCHRALGQWPQFARDLEAASGIALSYRKDGAVLAAADEAEAEELRRRAGPHGNCFLSAEEARARVPLLAPDIMGALWAPEEAQVDNRALGRALATAFVRAGGKLSANEAAVQVGARKDGGVLVRSAFGFHEADALVIAAGAWSGQIEGLPPEAIPPVHPVKGQMIALNPPAGAALPVPFVWGHGVYLVPRGQRLLVGATTEEEAGFDTAPSEAGLDWLTGRALKLMPALRSWSIDEHWAGLRPASADRLPVIGRTSMDDVFVASGQYRNGILFAPTIADSVEALILGRDVPSELAAFDPKRFRN